MPCMYTPITYTSYKYLTKLTGQCLVALKLAIVKKFNGLLDQPYHISFIEYLWYVYLAWSITKKKKNILYLKID
jgi:hypothetical protein